MAKLLNKKNAFTLIELIVVMAILGILAAIIVPIFAIIVDKANQATDNANARLIYNAAAIYYSVTDPAALVIGALSLTELGELLGDSMPTVRSRVFGGPADFSVTLVDSDGTLLVETPIAIYNNSTGKLE